MAVVWAKQAGNWTDTTLWAFWNESTQQIEDYGQVPQADDIVYANSYNININNANNLTVKKLTNGDLDFTGLGGGSFVRTNNGNFTINATIEAWERSNCVSNSGNVTTTWIINGDIIAKERLQNYFGLVAHNSSTGQPAIINGNLIGDRLISISVQYGNYHNIILPLTINGNVINEYDLPAIYYENNNNNEQLTINGNVNGYLATWRNRGVEISNIIINGNVDCDQKGFFTTSQANSFYTIDIFVTGVLRFNSKFHCRNLTINKIEYITTPFLMDIQNLFYYDASNFECRYVGPEPNPNPYIIINPNTIAQTYPPENKVLAPTQYGAQMELVGQYAPDYPPESVVLKDYEYGDSDDRKTGTMVQEVNVEVGCVTPEDVRKDVPLVGMGVVGSLVVPSVDDVREGVIFDNGSVGTLIVQGGGDRLRIADFGYYTNAQSDTYIVDLTEQDKPKFAVAEERVLIEMFPDLDLDNIPDKYFDDLFVKYLKYRLIVEYYRTAGINSTFTPSEPTTEIVNYQNVRNEVWLNSANIYLKAWGKKYPESITKPQRILL